MKGERREERKKKERKEERKLCSGAPGLVFSCQSPSFILPLHPSTGPPLSSAGCHALQLEMKKKKKLHHPFTFNLSSVLVYFC